MIPGTGISYYCTCLYSYIIHFRNLRIFCFVLFGGGVWVPCYRYCGGRGGGSFFRGVVFVFLFCFVLAGVLFIVLCTMLR